MSFTLGFGGMGLLTGTGTGNGTDAGGFGLMIGFLIFKLKMSYFLSDCPCTP